jgi:predicted permease
VIGRFIDPADDAPSAPMAAVLGERTWRASFGADSSVLGSQVRIGGDPYVVVGVAPESLHISRDGMVAAYVALSHLPATDRGLMTYRSSNARSVTWLHTVGRLAPGVSADAAARDIWAIGRALDTAAPLAPHATVPVSRNWRLTPAAEAGVHKDWEKIGRALLLLPMSIFLIICTSLANLVLSRGGNRRTEYGVRRALGASRASLVIELVMELTTIAAIGGAAAWVVAQSFIAGVARFAFATAGSTPRVHITTTLGSADAAALAVLVIVAVVIAGFVPAVALTSGTTSSSLTSASVVTPRWRGRRIAIAVQVAVALALQLVAALAVRGLSVDAQAFAKSEALSRIAVASVPLSLIDRDDDRAGGHADAIRDALSRAASRDRVAAVSMPSASSLNAVRVSRPDGVADADTRRSTDVDTLAVTANGVSTLGVPILRGRDFDATDLSGAPRVVVVSEKLAREEFGSVDVVGQNAFVISRDAHGARHQDLATIVGVAGQADTIRTNAEVAVAYFPLSQRFMPDLLFIARASSMDQANQAAGTMRAAIRGVDPVIPVSFAGRGDVMAGAKWMVARVVVTAVGVMSLFALLITMVGLYAVLSQAVALRRTEMGVRIALGATPARILALVLGDGAAPVAIGLAGGIGLGALGRFSAQPLFTRAVNAIDVPVAILAAIPMILAAAIACYVPARRASRIDPIRVLKEL